MFIYLPFCDIADEYLSHSRNDRDSVGHLTTELHQKEVVITTLQLKLNHAQLQIQALMANGQQIRSERDEMQFSLAVSEQDKLLLEVRHQIFCITNI